MNGIHHYIIKKSFFFLKFSRVCAAHLAHYKDTPLLKTSNSQNYRSTKKVVNTRQELERVLAELSIPLDAIPVNW